jgi:hypothetical protein
MFFHFPVLLDGEVKTTSWFYAHDSFSETLSLLLMAFAPNSVAYLSGRGPIEMSKTKISIRKLKDFAFAQLPKDWPLREILLSEEDELDIYVFLARLPVWLKLSKISAVEG